MAELGYTPSMQEEFARLVSVATPTAHDLRMLALIEAAGKSSYEAMVRGAPNDAVRRILTQNGREEYAHAVRLRRAAKLLFGEEFAIPDDSENPFATPADAVEPVSAESLEKMVQGEFMGGDFYDGWAATIEHEEAAGLLRQNGAEERRHGDRLREAIGLI
jgi:rubrerythrin